MKNLNIPIYFIVLCFVFGAWPVGVVLTVLRIISENAKEQEKEDAKRKAQAQNTAAYGAARRKTVYHSNYSSDLHTKEHNYSGGARSNYKTPEQVRAELAKMREEVAAKNAEALKKDTEKTEAVEPDTTYHYSYVKKDSGADSKNASSTTHSTRAAGLGEKNKSADSSAANNTAFANSNVKKNFKRSGATVLTTIAMAVSFLFSFIFFVNAVDWITIVGFADAMPEIASAMISSTISAVLYLFRKYYKSRDYRIITYLSVLRNKKYYSIAKLAQIADVSTSRAIKDLHYMQSKGFLGKYALIDKRTQYLIITSDGSAEAEAEYNRNAGLSREEAKAERETAKDEVTEEVSNLTEHEKILARIRELNDDIDDPTVSEKIDQIEELTRKIFKLVEEKPELQSQLQSFLSYYLPTTLKLLNSYAYFEDQGIKGENISAGMKNIEETLDMLISGYQHQLDKLFEADTLDVTTDINVLEQMMKADGFTKQKDFDITSEAKTFEDTFGGSGMATLELPDKDE